MPQLNDYIALWLLKLAKARRKTLTPKELNNADFYEEFFEDKDIEAYYQDARMEVRRHTIISALKDIRGSSLNLIDVGCGLGDVLAWMPQHFRLHGMDCALSNVQVTAKRLIDKAIVKQGSILSIPFDSESMDVCLCLEVIEHIDDHVSAVKDLYRILKPGGILLASVPYTYYWPDYLKLMGHYRHYTRESFADLISSNGFCVEKYLPNYPNWHQAYTRRYSLVRAESIIFGKLFGCTSPYRFKWPWGRNPKMEKLSSKLDYLKWQDALLNYANEPTSTFILARKK